MRLLLFTDTLGDINGVSRFIRNAADQAAATGRELVVMTSTRFDIPKPSYYKNFDPILAGKMPKYEHLELVWPPSRPMIAAAKAFRPHAIHVSTPGPVGMVGRKVARKLGVPLLGTYHTDFPAYLEQLFEDAVLGQCTKAVMRWFYAPFARIFSRSEDYMASMEAMGLDRSKMVRLLPGFDTSIFDPRFKDERIWDEVSPPRSTQHAARSTPIRVLSCGRVSVEKNLPLLTTAWKLAAAEFARIGLAAELVIVGDGPYRQTMTSELSGLATPVRFCGFRHAQELSRLYASSDLFVFPSTTDTLGQVVMESQASGLPAIVSDKGGPQSMILPGKTGLIVPGDNAQAWAAVIVDLVRDTPRRRAMGAAAHEHMQQYSFAKSFEHFWSVHEQAQTAGVRAG
ncbi:MAG: glycosyltransferase family 1 protein [Planctomycetota bacterium]